MIDLKNKLSPKVDNYPSTLDEAYQKMVNYTPKNPKQQETRRTDRVPSRGDKKNHSGEYRDNREAPGGREIAFAQSEGPPGDPGTAVTLTLIAGTDERTHNVICHGCQQQGHCRTQCPNNIGAPAASTTGT